MEQNQFEEQLRSLSEDFQVPASRGLFENLMEKRVQEKKLRQRNRQMLMAVAVLAVLFGAIGVNTLLTPALNEGGAADLRAELPQSSPSPAASSAGNSSQTTASPSPITATSDNTSLATAPAVPSSSSSTALSNANDRQVITRQAGTVKHSNDIGKQYKTAAVSEIQQPKSAEMVQQPAIVASEVRDAAPLRINHQKEKAYPGETKKNNTTVAVLTTDAAHTLEQPVSDKVQVAADNTPLAPADNSPKITTGAVMPPLVNDTLNTIVWGGDTFNGKEPSRFYPITLFCNTTYFPIVLSRNTSGTVPVATAVGLSEEALFAFGVKTGIMVDVNSSVAVGAGLGYYRVNYEKVRVAPNMKDTAVEGIVALSHTFEQNLADISFTWFDAPVFIQYRKTLGRNLSFNLRTGLSYQHLIHTQSYLFTTEQKYFDYRVVENYDNKRVEQHQLAFMMEPGITYHAGKHFGIYAAAAYQQQFWSYYQSAFASRSPASLLGVTSGVQYKF